jgi:nucleoside-diphosphate kinase
MEKTYIMIKPDGVQRGLVAEVIKRFEQKGFSLRGLKLMNVSKSHAETHYSDLSDKCEFLRAHIVCEDLGMATGRYDAM